MDCVLCDRRISDDNDSEEHVLPQAIGGKLKARSVVCRECNGWTGREWDSALCEQLNWFSLILGVTRERGEPPAMPLKTVDGEELLLLADGSMTPRRPTFERVPAKGAATALHIVARGPDEARRLLDQATRRYPTLDVTAALESARPTTRYLESPVQLSLNFGGPRTERSVVKSALVFAASHGVDARLCVLARRYLRSRDQHEDASQAEPPFSLLAADGATTELLQPEVPLGYFFARDLLPGRPDRALHGVAVSNRGTDGQLLAYLEYFEARRCVVRLAEHYEGPEIHAGYFIDPVKGEPVSQEFDLALTRKEVDATLAGERASCEQMVTAFSGVLGRAVRSSFDRELNRVVTAALDDGLAASETQFGDELTPEKLAVIMRTVADRVAPLIIAQRRRL